jgi:hypothetical protein
LGCLPAVPPTSAGSAAYRLLHKHLLPARNFINISPTHQQCILQAASQTTPHLEFCA